MNASATPADRFQCLMKRVTDRIKSRLLGAQLEQELNECFPAQGEFYYQVLEACQAAIADGWMCQREGGGIKYGRVIKPSVHLDGFSVDVVDMNSIAGPHHSHPNGEVDLIMPLTAGAKFDGSASGWLVYGPGTAHAPTVSEGRALVLYLLPQGAIEFTR